MRKELHPGLFSEGFIEDGRMAPLPEVGGIELNSLNSVAESRRMDKKLEALVVETRAKQEELNRGMIQRYEHFLSKLGSLESRFEALSQDLRQKNSALSSKVTESHLSNMKTQALIDKHTQLLRQFEQRVASLNKVIEEQEFQIMGYKSALDDARKDLAKLKKL